MAMTVTNLHGTARELVDGTAFKLLIDGKLVDARSHGTYETRNPYDDAVLAAVPAAEPADVDLAVRSARRAYEESWRDLSVSEPVGYVRRVLEVIDERQEELAILDTLDGGNPITAMRGDAANVGRMVEPALGWVTGLRTEVIPGQADHLHYTVDEPYGVVARLVPYNHPLLGVSRALLPLLVGNTVVLKTPDHTPLSGLRLGELVADVLPPGVLNILSGQGPVAGDALVRHPLVRRVAFTGSPQVGMAIQRSAAESAVKHVTLELGGKNPMLVLEDADPELAGDGAVKGMNLHWTGGQSCGSTTRLLVHESLAEEVVQRVVAGAEAVRIGDPLDPEVEMGTMVSQAHYERVMGYIERARADGATLVTGGGRPEGLDHGHFVAPTVFRDVRPDSELAQEEVFGPVLSVMTFSDEDEAVAIANGVNYGLTGSIWTPDLGHAQRLARRIEAGFVWINTTSMHYAGVPFGGVKDSGIGREEHAQELESYLQTKAVNVHLGVR